MEPLEGALETVLQLQGVAYDAVPTKQRSLGLIAEDVGQVLPELVRYEANGEDAAGVDYARLTAVLVEAVKEQQAMIDELREELGRLRD